MSTATTTPPTPWPTVKLGDVCELKRGLTYKKTDEVLDSSIKVLRSNNIDLESNSLDLSEVKCLRDDLKIAKDKFVLKDSILMCMANGSKIHLGKVALIDTDELFAFGGFMGLLVPKGINPKFLYFTLCSPIFKNYVGALQDGANINNLKFSDISNYPIHLPPLEVQREIVAKVESGLKEADGLVAHFKRLTTLADATFKAELDETFSALNAPTVKLGDVCEVVLGGTPSTKIEDYWGGDVNWLTPSDMGKIEGMYVESTSRKITQEGLLKGSRLFPEKSVIVSTRAPIGYVLINTVPMCTNQGCKTLVPNKDVLAEFLCLNLRGRTDELNALGTGTTFRELATGNLKSISIPLPSLNIQREIVGKLEALKAWCERLKAEAERGLKAAEALRKAVLAEAFEQ